MLSDALRMASLDPALPAMIVIGVPYEQACASPTYDCVRLDLQALCDLGQSEQMAGAQPLVAALEFVRVTHTHNHRCVVSETIAGSQSFAVDLIGDFSVGVIIQEAIDLGNHRGWSLPHHPRWVRQWRVQSVRLAAVEAYLSSHVGALE
jgi:hypothetical protein